MPVPKVGETSVVASGTYSSVTKPANLIFSDAKAFREYWEKIQTATPKPRPPLLDFASCRVAVLQLGTKPTGGYGIRFDSVTADTSSITLRYTEIVPGPRDATTQALTSPYLVVKIPRTPSKVIFINVKK